jgi:hypothetical protein
MNWLIAFIVTIILLAFLGPIGAVVAVAIWATLVLNKSKSKK